MPDSPPLQLFPSKCQLVDWCHYRFTILQLDIGHQLIGLNIVKLVHCVLTILFHDFLPLEINELSQGHLSFNSGFEIFIQELASVRSLNLISDSDKIFYDLCKDYKPCQHSVNDAEYIFS